MPCLMAALVVVGLGVLVALPFIGAYLGFKLMGKKGGLDALIERYPAGQAPQGPVYTRQFVAVGPAYYANNGEFRPTPEGLYLQVRPFFLNKYAPVFIPWGEFKGAEVTMLALQSAVRLSVGTQRVATITITRRLYDQMAAYLHLPV